MDRDEFLSLPASEIASLAQAYGPQVCAFAVNGTRRWFRLEYSHAPEKDYLDLMGDLQLRLCGMFFDYGLGALVMPVFGPELLNRGSLYRKIAIWGLERLACDERLVEFYQTQDVRVRFYGDYESFFAQTPDTAHLCRLFDDLVQRTQANSSHYLFYGVCAQDSTANLAALAVRLFQQTGQAPTKAEMIEAYYGVPLERVDLFIGFDYFSAFDMPLLSTDETNLYYTVSPSPYMTERQLREILYDHLFARHMLTPDMGTGMLSDPHLEDMRAFYRANAGRTQGLGFKWGSIWYPLSQVEIPEHMRRDWNQNS